LDQILVFVRTYLIWFFQNAFVEYFDVKTKDPYVIYIIVDVGIEMKLKSDS